MCRLSAAHRRCGAGEQPCVPATSHLGQRLTHSRASQQAGHASTFCTPAGSGATSCLAASNLAGPGAEAQDSSGEAAVGLRRSAPALSGFRPTRAGTRRLGEILFPENLRGAIRDQLVKSGKWPGLRTWGSASGNLATTPATLSWLSTGKMAGSSFDRPRNDERPDILEL